MLWINNDVNFMAIFKQKRNNQKSVYAITSRCFDCASKIFEPSNVFHSSVQNFVITLNVSYITWPGKQNGFKSDQSVRFIAF